MTPRLWPLFLCYFQVVLASESPPLIVGEGLSRVPENGIAEEDQALQCLLNGQAPDEVQWFIINKDGAEVALVTDDGQSSVKAEDSEAKYRCKLDDEHYADFIVGNPEDDTSNLLKFRVEKFKKSYSVVEQEDLKIKCEISNRTSDIDLKSDVIIKWYIFNVTGDELSYVSSIGNCSEDLQHSLNWHEVVVNKGQGEPHINMIEADDTPRKVLKIEDASRQTDRRAFKCVAFHREARGNCSESAFFVRVRDKYAALWPFLGIVSEVVVICLVIFICERRRASTAKDDMNDDEDDEINGGSHGMAGTSGNSNFRNRGNKAS